MNPSYKYEAKTKTFPNGDKVALFLEWMEPRLIAGLLQSTTSQGKEVKLGLFATLPSDNAELLKFIAAPLLANKRVLLDNTSNKLFVESTLPLEVVSEFVIRQNEEGPHSIRIQNTSEAVAYLASNAIPLNSSRVHIEIKGVRNVNSGST